MIDRFYNLDYSSTTAVHQSRAFRRRALSVVTLSPLWSAIQAYLVSSGIVIESSDEAQQAQGSRRWYMLLYTHM